MCNKFAIANFKKPAMKEVRPFSRYTTDNLAKRVEEIINWESTLHSIYVELAHRERASAKKLRSDLVSFFQQRGGYFSWPTTEIQKGSGRLPNDVYEHQVGVLGFMGYKVGEFSAPKAKRQALLDDIYLDHLPFVNSAAYMAKWSSPKTAKRLEQIAISIAEFAKAKKKSDPTKYAKAIGDWESDLEYLRQTHYEGKYSFKWPATSSPESARTGSHR